MAKLRLIHVSDLHLFVDANGYRRPQAEIYRMVRLALLHPQLPLVGGFRVHEDNALQALRRAITNLSTSSPDPVVLIQSGDVSTFGASMSGRSTTFPEWDFWASERMTARPRQPIAWIDLFGNHDVWPGTLPGLAPHLVERVRDRLRSTHHRVQLPDRVGVSVGGDLVEIYRLNTVQHTSLANTFAKGTIAFDHPDRTAPQQYPDATGDPLIRLAELAQQHRPQPPARVVRIIVMHHPPHFFGLPTNSAGAFWAQLKGGRLDNAPQFTSWLEQQQDALPFHIVLAGHRHQLDPAHNMAPSTLGQSDTIQVVCATPTQTLEPADPDHSFSVYDLDFQAGSVAVDRIVYERAATDIDFASIGTSRLRSIT